MVSRSHCWMLVSIPVLNSGGKVVDVLRRMGCCSGSVMVQRVYFLLVCCSRMAVNGSDASSSIGIMGEAWKAPRIRLEAMFWSFCSLSVYPFCPLHQASVPKSRIGRTQLVYSWCMCWELSPHSLVFNLQHICRALEAYAIFLSTCVLKLSFRSKKTPSYRSTVEGVIVVPLGSVTEHCGECRRQWKWISSVLGSLKATALLSPHSKAVLATASCSFQFSYALSPTTRQPTSSI